MFIPRMTWGNWLYWGILAFVGINFLWLGWLELYIPQWIGAPRRDRRGGGTGRGHPRSIDRRCFWVSSSTRRQSQRFRVTSRQGLRVAAAKGSPVPAQQAVPVRSDPAVGLMCHLSLASNHRGDEDRRGGRRVRARSQTVRMP